MKTVFVKHTKQLCVERQCMNRLTSKDKQELVNVLILNVVIIFHFQANIYKYSGFNQD